MKTLIVYYSRTGTTKKVAELLAQELKTDIEEVIDTKDRRGAVGYILAGRDAVTKKLAVIRELKYKPSDYDLIIIGTPVWALNMASAIRTYISQNKDLFKNLAFFCTLGGSGAKRTFEEMEALSSKAPLALMELKTKEVIDNNFQEKMKEFITKLIK